MRNKVGITISVIPTIVLGVSACAMTIGKAIRGIKMGKEVKVSLIADSMIEYLKNSIINGKTYILIKEFSETA
jgi:hypothetical protein